MYRLYAAISIIIGMYLDSVLFAKVNIAGVVPDCVLVVKGNELYVVGMPQEGTKGLRAGEVMLFSKGASVKVTNDGKILLHGDVYVQGDLYVNGQKMEVP